MFVLFFGYPAYPIKMVYFEGVGCWVLGFRFFGTQIEEIREIGTDLK